jgi:hypothetical protein
VGFRARSFLARSFAVWPPRCSAERSLLPETRPPLTVTHRSRSSPLPTKTHHKNPPQKTKQNKTTAADADAERQQKKRRRRPNKNPPPQKKTVDIKRCKEAGYHTVQSILMATRKKLADVKGLSEAKCEKIQGEARKLAPIGLWMSGSDALVVELFFGGSFVALFCCFLLFYVACCWFLGHGAKMSALVLWFLLFLRVWGGRAARAPERKDNDDAGKKKRLTHLPRPRPKIPTTQTQPKQAKQPPQ